MTEFNDNDAALNQGKPSRSRGLQRAKPAETIAAALSTMAEAQIQAFTTNQLFLLNKKKFIKAKFFLIQPSSEQRFNLGIDTSNCSKRLNYPLFSSVDWKSLLVKNPWFNEQTCNQKLSVTRQTSRSQEHHPAQLHKIPGTTQEQAPQTDSYN